MTLSLGHLWNVFNLRDHRTGMFVNDVSCNAYVWGAIVMCLSLIAAALWLPGLSGLLKIQLPGANGLALAATASLIPVAAGQIWIVLMHRKKSG